MWLKLLIFTCFHLERVKLSRPRQRRIKNQMWSTFLNQLYWNCTEKLLQFYIWKRGEKKQNRNVLLLKIVNFRTVSAVWRVWGAVCSQFARWCAPFSTLMWMKKLRPRLRLPSCRRQSPKPLPHRLQTLPPPAGAFLPLIEQRERKKVLSLQSIALVQDTVYRSKSTNKRVRKKNTRVKSSIKQKTESTAHEMYLRKTKKQQ